MSLFYTRVNLSQRGRKEPAAKYVLSMDRNNQFIVLFIATETQSQGIKRAHKKA